MSEDREDYIVTFSSPVCSTVQYILFLCTFSETMAICGLSIKKNCNRDLVLVL